MTSHSSRSRADRGELGAAAMLIESPPPQPGPDAVWTGGYWVWRDNWVWAQGRWSEPPGPRYHWVPPYYENRRDRVVFVDGFWSPPERSFVPPPSGLNIAAGHLGGRGCRRCHCRA